MLYHDAVENLKHIGDFCLPVITILEDLEGRAHIEQIYEFFLAKYRSRLDHSFFTEIKDNDIKWRDYINRAGYRLAKKGYISRSRRGIWELTDKQFLR
jgi:hypothetical protein